jgi:RNA polymerase sigma-B factor
MDSASTSSSTAPPSRPRGGAQAAGADVHTGGREAVAEGDPRELFVAWQRHDDERARERLVERYLPLARRLARRYARSSEPLDDLVQVASLGLLHAIDRFDVDRGRPFSAFAVPTILGEMRRHFRDAGWAVHVPRATKERTLELRAAEEALQSLHGRSPTVSQLAEYLELDLEQVLDAMSAIEAYETCSLDAPRPSDDGTGGSYADSIGEEDERLELIECDATLCSAIVELAPRDRAILRMRFVEDLTQSQIAGRIGISQMQVSRLLRRSLSQLQTASGVPAEGA